MLVILKLIACCTPQGHEITSILGLKAGAWLTGIQEGMVDWQWQNLGIGKSGVAAWLLGQRERLLLEGAVEGIDERKGKKGKKEKGG